MTDLPQPEALLPHRGPWLLLRSIEHADETSLTGTAAFGLEHADGHFPGQPVVPGVLLLEVLAQASAALARMFAAADTAGKIPFLVGYDRVRFRTPVVPPATVTVTVRRGESVMGVHSTFGEIRIDGRRACNAEIRATFVDPTAAQRP